LGGFGRGGNTENLRQCRARERGKFKKSGMEKRKLQQHGGPPIVVAVSHGPVCEKFQTGASVGNSRRFWRVAEKGRRSGGKWILQFGKRRGGVVGCAVGERNSYTEDEEERAEGGESA